MNTRHLTITALALALGSTVAFAQSKDGTGAPPTGNADSSPQKTEAINAQDSATGNNLSANRKDGTSSGDSDKQKTAHVMSQDSTTGNNLYGGAGFDTLDVRKNGALTMADAKSNTWLRENFKTCDADNDRKVSRDEYIRCSPAQ